ncbi:MAG: DUF5615 family PIN-like protein [Verrucomicrobiota bacterium]|nr:DUF5615 family PIN-like protein [Verrucomicrobiota bacterium]
MRVLFDQGTPVPLRKHFAGHDVVTAFEAGWSEVSNGELLAKAEEQFDVLVTTDKQLRYQQNLTGRRIAIVVLPHASWLKLEPHAGRDRSGCARGRTGQVS